VDFTVGVVGDKLGGVNFLTARIDPGVVTTYAAGERERARRENE